MQTPNSKGANLKRVNFNRTLEELQKVEIHKAYDKTAAGPQSFQTHCYDSGHAKTRLGSNEFQGDPEERTRQENWKIVVNWKRTRRRRERRRDTATHEMHG